MGHLGYVGYVALQAQWIHEVCEFTVGILYVFSSRSAGEK